jgi:hypothetical protein
MQDDTIMAAEKSQMQLKGFQGTIMEILRRLFLSISE